MCRATIGVPAGAVTHSLDDRIWQAAPELLAVGADGAAHRAVARFGAIVGVDLGVRFPWGIRAHAGAVTPGPGDAAEALDWCRARDSGAGFSVCVPASRPRPAPWNSLRVADELPTFATTPDRLQLDDVVPPAGVTLSFAPSHEQVVAAYGGWMEDEQLARILVVPGDLSLRERAFVVASSAGRPIGCAFVWWAAGTAYLSGIGVVRRHRNQGIGRALTVAASRVAVTSAPAGSQPDVVWMHATLEGARLYRSLGFEATDSELHLRD
jgi:ribosomal protein S18 acetylase RimI-like enzyme